MRNLFLIAKREYLERVRTRAFMIATVLIPAIMLGAIKFSTHGAKTAGHIAIVSADTSLALDLKQELEDGDNSQMKADVYQPTSGWEKHLDSVIDAGQLDGYLVIDNSGTQPQITYASASKGDIMTKSTLNAALRRVLTRERLLHRGMQRDEIDTLLKTPVMQTETVSDGHISRSDTNSGFYSAYALFFLMYFVVMLHGINVASSVVEEKTSRVFEVMLATVKPAEMMGGKLLGVGAVGLTQVAIWIGFIAAMLFTPLLAAVGAGGFKVSLSSSQLFFFVVFFVLGFMLYSAIAAAIGALVNSEQELRQFNMVIALPMAVNTIVLYPVVTASNSTLSVILSMIPTSTPLLMFLRMSIAPVPAWQVALSLVLLCASIAGVVWLAARIYRVGILMYGKRPNLPEILRWIRYS